MKNVQKIEFDLFYLRTFFERSKKKEAVRERHYTYVQILISLIKKNNFLFTKVSNRDELICLNEENECPSIVE